MMANPCSQCDVPIEAHSPPAVAECAIRKAHQTRPYPPAWFAAFEAEIEAQRDEKADCYPPNACAEYRGCDVHCFNCGQPHDEHTDRDRIGCQADLHGVASLPEDDQVIYELGYRPAPTD